MVAKSRVVVWYAREIVVIVRFGAQAARAGRIGIGSFEEEDYVGRIVVTEFMSLDGVIEAPGGGESYKHAGWSFKISRGEEGDKFKLDETMSSVALLLGRVTYEGFAAA